MWIGDVETFVPQLFALYHTQVEYADKLDPDMMFVLVPSPPAMHRRNMHQALLVPEILLIIFNHITDNSGNPLLPTLAAVARTCRSFRRHVDEILWSNLPSISALFNTLPPRVRQREFQSWSLNRRMFSGPDWTRFLDRASRVRVLVENTNSRDEHERCSAIFLAMAALRDPILLTPNLRKLKWQTSHTFLSPAINLFISPSLQSLEIDAKLLIDHVIRVPLGDICPKLGHIKITGNARSAAGTISDVLCRLHCLETVACSTLDNDAFVHLTQLKTLSHLTVDMRWSVLSLDTLGARLRPGSFLGLQTLCWKDYNLHSLADVFLMSDVSPSNIHLEIESFCTSASLRSFLRLFTAKFPCTHAFSLVHDIKAGRRFGLQVGTPGREHQLNACDLKPLLALKSLRALNLVDLGYLRLDDDFFKAIASAFPELEQLRIDTDTAMTPSVTFDGLLALLERCPNLRSVELCIDAEDILSFWDTPVRHDRLTHLRLEGSILGSRRAEVDEMLRRVLPRLMTVEESLDGVTRRVREIGVVGKEGATRACVRGGRRTGRRPRNSLEGA